MGLLNLSPILVKKKDDQNIINTFNPFTQPMAINVSNTINSAPKTVSKTATKQPTTLNSSAFSNLTGRTSPLSINNPFQTNSRLNLPKSNNIVFKAPQKNTEEYDPNDLLGTFGRNFGSGAVRTGGYLVGTPIQWIEHFGWGNDNGLGRNIIKGGENLAEDINDPNKVSEEENQLVATAGSMAGTLATSIPGLLLASLSAPVEGAAAAGGAAAGGAAWLYNNALIAGLFNQTYDDSIANVEAQKKSRGEEVTDGDRMRAYIGAAGSALLMKVGLGRFGNWINSPGANTAEILQKFLINTGAQGATSTMMGVSSDIGAQKTAEEIIQDMPANWAGGSIGGAMMSAVPAIKNLTNENMKTRATIENTADARLRNRGIDPKDQTNTNKVINERYKVAKALLGEDVAATMYEPNQNIRLARDLRINTDETASTAYGVLENNLSLIEASTEHFNRVNPVTGAKSTVKNFEKFKKTIVNQLKRLSKEHTKLESSLEKDKVEREGKIVKLEAKKQAKQNLFDRAVSKVEESNNAVELHKSLRQMRLDVIAKKQAYDKTSKAYDVIGRQVKQNEKAIGKAKTESAFVHTDENGNETHTYLVNADMNPTRRVKGHPRSSFRVDIKADSKGKKIIVISELSYGGKETFTKALDYKKAQKDYQTTDDKVLSERVVNSTRVYRGKGKYDWRSYSKVDQQHRYTREKYTGPTEQPGVNETIKTLNKTLRQQKRALSALEKHKTEFEESNLNYQSAAAANESRVNRMLRRRKITYTRNVNELQRQMDEVDRKIKAEQAKLDSSREIDRNIKDETGENVGTIKERQTTSRGKSEEKLEKLAFKKKQLDTLLNDINAQETYIAHLVENAKAMTPEEIEKLAYGKTSSQIGEEMQAFYDGNKVSPFRRFVNQRNANSKSYPIIIDGIKNIISNMYSSGKVGRVAMAKAIDAVFGGAGMNEDLTMRLSQRQHRITGSLHTAREAFDRFSIMEKKSQKKILKFFNASIGNGEGTSMAEAKKILNNMTDDEKIIAAAINKTFTYIHDLNVESGLISEYVDKINRGRWMFTQYMDPFFQKELQEKMSKVVRRGKGPGEGRDLYDKREVGAHTKYEKSQVNDFGVLLRQAYTTAMANKITKDTMANIYESPHGKEYFSDEMKHGYYHKLGEDKFAKALFGKAAGKYIRDDLYNELYAFDSKNELLNNIWGALAWYDNLALRRLQKTALTVYNPGVWEGNYMFNYPLAYLSAGSVNMPAYIKNYNQAVARGLTDANALKSDPIFRQLQEAGCPFGENVAIGFENTKAMREWGIEHGYMPEELAKQGNHLSDVGQFIEDKLISPLGAKYGAVDDAAKYALGKTYMESGLTAEQAARLVSRSMQNYSHVGMLWKMVAMAPLFGQPFIRFTADLCTRIAPNMLIQHPFRVMNLFGGIFLASLISSALSGEDEEDREKRGENELEYAANTAIQELPFTPDEGRGKEYKERTNRPGARKLFGLIPSNVLIGDKEVDVSRYFGNYMTVGLPNSDTEDQDTAQLAESIMQMSPLQYGADPFATPLVKGAIATAGVLTGNDAVAESQQDFTGNPIITYHNYETSKQEAEDKGYVSDQQKLANIGTWMWSQTLPPTVWDSIENVNALSLAGTDEEGLSAEYVNHYGSKTTPFDVLMRSFGVRTSTQTAETAKARQDKAAYPQAKTTVWNSGEFSGMQLDAYTKHLEDRAYDKGDKLQTGKLMTQQEVVTDIANRLAHLDDFEIDKAIANEKSKLDGKPIQPIYTLTRDQYRTYLLVKQANESGTTADGDELVFKNPWVKDIMKRQAEYMVSYIKDNPTDESTSVDRQLPSLTMPNNIQRLYDIYQQFTDASDDSTVVSTAKRNFLSDHPELKEFFDKSFEQNNKERLALGYSALAKYPEVTPELQAKLDYYYTLPKGTGARSSYLKANPDIQNYWLQKNIYENAGPFGDGIWASGSSNKTLEQVANDAYQDTYGGYSSKYLGGSYVHQMSPKLYYFRSKRPTYSVGLSKTALRLAKKLRRG